MERWESNPGRLGGKRERYHCAVPTLNFFYCFNGASILSDLKYSLSVIFVCNPFNWSWVSCCRRLSRSGRCCCCARYCCCCFCCWRCCPRNCRHCSRCRWSYHWRRCHCHCHYLCRRSRRRRCRRWGCRCRRRRRRCRLFHRGGEKDPLLIGI